MKTKLQSLFLILLLCSVTILHATNSSDMRNCQYAATNFLMTPNMSTLSALKEKDAEECWQEIGGSDVNLKKLFTDVKRGNSTATSYLLINLKRLDGGNLEDSLISLGEFSDVDMKSLLSFTKQGLLSRQELGDALTMLPASMSDDQKTQLSVMQSREDKINQITSLNLSNERELALKAIVEFKKEVERSLK